MIHESCWPADPSEEELWLCPACLCVMVEDHEGPDNWGAVFVPIWDLAVYEMWYSGATLRFCAHHLRALARLEVPGDDRRTAAWQLLAMIGLKEYARRIFGRAGRGELWR